MEKPTSTAIDYNYSENRVIEDMVRNNYHHIQIVIDDIINSRVRNPNQPVGLCCNFIERDKELWRFAIKPWFTSQRFNLEHVYFAYSNMYLENNKDGCFSIGNQVWLRVPLNKLYPNMLQTAFWFPTVKEYNALRLKVLEHARKDLERIKNKGDIPLPLLTLDEPIVY